MPSDERRPTTTDDIDNIAFDKEALSKVNRETPSADATTSGESGGGGPSDTAPRSADGGGGDSADGPADDTTTPRSKRPRLATKRRLAIAHGEKISKKMRPLEVTDRNSPPKDPLKVPPRKTSDGYRAADPDDPKYTEVTPLVVTAFMAALSISGRPTVVARELRVDYMLILDLKKHDPEFRARFEEAMHAAFDHQEDEVRRRAFEGYERPVYQMGKLIGHETVYSDALAMTMLKAERPEKYNPKTIQTIEHAGAVGMTVAAMTDEELNEAINKKLRFLGVIHAMPNPTIDDVAEKITIPTVHNTGDIDEGDDS